MTSTYTLQNSINWASIYCRLQPLTGVGSISNEPGLTICNTVAQILLSPPLRWRWNRATITSTATAASATLALASSAGITSIEKAYITSPVFAEMEIRNVIATDGTQGRPGFLCPLTEDTTDNNLSCILFPTPDLNYGISVIAQKAPALFTSLSATWSPIPDHMGYIYNTGVLALSMMYAEHPAFQMMFMRFLSSLAGACEGITEQEKSLFIGNYQYLLEAQQSMAALRASGERGVYGVQA